MSNEPVDGLNVPDELEEQQEQQQPAGTLHPTIIFRLKTGEFTFFQRMADHFWRSGIIKEPKLNALGRACLNIVANKYSHVEDKNYNQYVARRLEEARASATLRPREPYNPRYRPQGEFDPARDYFDAREQPRVPPQLRRDPPIEKVEVDWW